MIDFNQIKGWFLRHEAAVCKVEKCGATCNLQTNGMAKWNAQMECLNGMCNWNVQESLIPSIWPKSLISKGGSPMHSPTLYSNVAQQQHFKPKDMRILQLNNQQIATHITTH